MFAFLRAEARWILAGFLLTGFSGFGQTYFISLSNAALREQFNLSHGQIGLAYSLATLCSAFALLEFGRLVDRVSTRLAAWVAIAGLATACALMAGAQSVWMLVLAFFGLRLFGQGMMSHVAMTATGRWFETQRGRAVSLVSLGYPVSEALLPSLAVFILLHYGFVTLWLAAAMLLAFALIPVIGLLLARERVPRAVTLSSAGSSTPEKRSWRRSELLREWSFWLLLSGVLCPAFMVTGLFFHQQHLVAIKGWTLEGFAAGFSVFAGTQIVSGLVAGMLTDRFSARALLPVYLVPMALGLCLPLLLDADWTILVLMFALGLTGGTAATVMGALWPELFGVHHLGEIRALAFAAMVISSAASPILVGTLIDLGIGFPLQLAGMGVYALLASALMGLIQPRLSSIASDRIDPVKLA